MDLRAASSRYGNALLGVVLGVGFAAETLAYGARPVAVVTALLAGLALTLRRQAPVASFLLTVGALFATLRLAPGVDGATGAFVVAYIVAHYSVGRWSRGLEAWLGAGCVLLSMVQFAIADAAANDTGVSDISLGSVGFTAFFVGGPWAAGLAIRLRRERESALGLENERLHRQQEERAARAVAEERSRIARELHDVVSHAISVTVLQARGARRTLDTDPASARAALDAIEQTNTAALGDMRRLLAVLRDTESHGRPPDDHAPQPSLLHLDALVEQVRASGLPVEVEIVGAHVAVPPGVDLSAYRIVQEALTNVLKHAESAPTLIRLEYAEEALVVSVHDRGGRAPAVAVDGDGGGHGLIGIRERVAVVGGEVEAGPRDDGFEVRARLPYALGDA